jgi:hypothetical protein
MEWMEIWMVERAPIPVLVVCGYLMKDGRNEPHRVVMICSEKPITAPKLSEPVQLLWLTPYFIQLIQKLYPIVSRIINHHSRVDSE